jgi:hypothetical protein
LAGNWPEITPNTPFLPDIPVRKWLKTNARLPLELHGMEEVVGSIPTRSTKFLHQVPCCVQDFGCGLPLSFRFARAQKTTVVRQESLSSTVNWRFISE